MSRRRPPLPSPTFALDRACAEPLHRQLHAALAGLIRSGRVAEGARLPSTRLLAEALGVSRNTVLYAYDDLMAEGLVLGRTGSGTCVIAAAPRGPEPPDLEALARAARLPLTPRPFRDPDGNELYLNG